MARRLTEEQWGRVLQWSDSAELYARAHFPKDRDAAHDLAVDSLIRAVIYSDQTDLAGLLRKIMRQMFWKLVRKRKTFGGIKERFESIDWLEEDDYKKLQYIDTSHDIGDTEDLIDFVTIDLHKHVAVILKARARGEEYKHSCVSRGIKYLGVRGSIVQNKQALRERIARQLEIA